MTTEVANAEVMFVLAPEDLPRVEDLVTEDDTPVDNLRSEKHQRLLTETLYSSWQGPSGRSWIALANVGMFYSLDDPPFVPDVLVSLDCVFPTDLTQKRNRSYFTWVYGKLPDAIIEIVSNKKGGEETAKLAAYARLRVPIYVIYDPDEFLSADPLRAYQLQGDQYVPIDRGQSSVWLPPLELGLSMREGEYEGIEDIWLRWVEADGTLLPTGKERSQAAEERERSVAQRAKLEAQRAKLEARRAKSESQRANSEARRAASESQRAASAEERAARLEQQLRDLGVDPQD